MFVRQKLKYCITLVPSLGEAHTTHTTSFFSSQSDAQSVCQTQT